MELTSPTLTALYTGIKTAFQAGMQSGATKDYAGIATVVPSNNAIEEYPILQLPGKWKQWVGPRQFKNLDAKSLTVKNQTFQDGFAIGRDQFDDNQLGWVGAAANALGVGGENLWDDMLFAAMVGNGAWLDGNAFFYATRKYGKNTINNIVASALTATTYATARAAMMAYLDAEGVPLKAVPNTLIVGPKLEATAKKIVESPYVAGSIPTGESSYVSGVTDANPYYGTAKLIVSTRLVGDYDDYWFLLDTRGQIKPFLVQQREMPTIDRQDKATDDCVFTENEIRYGARARGAAALAIPHLAYAGIL